MARTAKELATEIGYYQIHFHRREHVPVHPEMTEAVLSLVLRHLSLARGGDRGYIASKLQLEETSLEQGIDELLGNRSKFVAWPGALELALRCLTQLFKEKAALSPSELSHATHLLKPLAERVREDLVCQAFSSR